MILRKEDFLDPLMFFRSFLEFGLGRFRLSFGKRLGKIFDCEGRWDLEVSKIEKFLDVWNELLVLLSLMCMRMFPDIDDVLSMYM